MLLIGTRGTTFLSWVPIQDTEAGLLGHVVAVLVF